MIPQAYIQHWRQHAPWRSDAQVEQDLVISRALVDLFSMSEIAENLAFRGGTALHKLYFSPPVRYSEDIDLVQVTPAPIGPVLDAIRVCLRPSLGDAHRYVQKANMCTLVYRFNSESATPVPLRLKVEIMTREAFNVLGVIDRAFDVQSPWFMGATTLRTFQLEELLGTKLRALYQRRKGRDVFDLALALERSPGLDRQAIVDCFTAYMQRAGEVPTRAQLEANLDLKRVHQAFMDDMSALLHPDYGDYDAVAALECVQRELIARLP
jgi:predicted nucleotidyltransferase component of viral defense system